LLAQGSGVPSVESRALDLGGDQVAAEVGCEQAQPGELPAQPLGAGERHVAAERDAAEPHGTARRARGCQELVLDLLEHRAVGPVAELERREHQVDLERPRAQRRDEPLVYEVLRRRVGGRQQHDAGRGALARAGRLEERAHQPSAAAGARAPGAASMAEKSSANSAPGATVRPRSASTGTREVASTPKASTVARLATASEASVSGCEPGCAP